MGSGRDCRQFCFTLPGQHSAFFSAKLSLSHFLAFLISAPRWPDFVYGSYRAFTPRQREDCGGTGTVSRSFPKSRGPRAVQPRVGWSLSCPLSLPVSYRAYRCSCPICAFLYAQSSSISHSYSSLSILLSFLHWQYRFLQGSELL